MKEEVKGFRDIEGEEAEKRLEIQKILSDEFEKYGFEPAETPVIEYEEFVKSGNENDEAVSDIFKLKDRGERKLALRYEFTFQLKRLAQGKKLPYKRFQIGPVFRDEPISGNRFRQFTQCDVDIIGSNIKDEAEILSLASKILVKLGIKFKVYINNRKLLNEILESMNISGENKDKVIREIDKLDKLSENEVKTNLKKYNAEKVILILKNKKEYFKKFNSFKEIEELEKYCKIYGIKVEFSPFLARGLSYYDGTVFEIKSDIKETICAGGSYSVDGIKSTGVSFGLDRLAIVSKLNVKKKKMLIISLDQDKKAIELASKLRDKGNNVILMYGKPSKALEYANAKSINYAVFVGEKEVKSKKYKIKDMKTGKETSVSEKDLIVK
jgi:histidyl-tRNA synthetase